MFVYAGWVLKLSGAGDTGADLILTLDWPYGVLTYTLAPPSQPTPELVLILFPPHQPRSYHCLLLFARMRICVVSKY